MSTKAKKCSSEKFCQKSENFTGNEERNRQEGKDWRGKKQQKKALTCWWKSNRFLTKVRKIWSLFWTGIPNLSSSLENIFENGKSRIVFPIRIGPLKWVCVKGYDPVPLFNDDDDDDEYDDDEDEIGWAALAILFSIYCIVSLGS